MNKLFKAYPVLIILLTALLPAPANAQQQVAYRPPVIIAKNKPYRILTSGKQITIRSRETLSSVMVWTAGGHRVFEQKELDKDELQIQLTVQARFYFLMIRLRNGESYSEKIGVGGN
jgi:hypothetical protein